MNWIGVLGLLVIALGAIAFLLSAFGYLKSEPGKRPHGELALVFFCWMVVFATNIKSCELLFGN